jgi:LmbE family N-acetylglucosaminyl deacetylase
MNEPALVPSWGSLGDGGTVLILLAHQDDEIAFSQLITRARADGTRVRVVYLTNGGAGARVPARRAEESVRALAALRVPRSEIRFLGTDLSIPDGELFRHLAAAYRALLQDCAGIGDLGALLTLAWEGGHPDHDAAHVLAIKLARERGAEHRTWQVPFYRAADSGPPFFSLFAPLAGNGPALDLPAAREGAWQRAGMIRFYPSQWRAFAGLGPAILWHALIGTPSKVQKVRVRGILERPTAGPLLYESRNHVSFAELAGHANCFLEDGDADRSDRSPRQSGHR